jgi:hypothetical protein
MKHGQQRDYLLARWLGFVLLGLSFVFANAEIAQAIELRAGDRWIWQNPPVQGNQLWGVWGSSPSDIFAVGVAGTLLHYDGTRWDRINKDIGRALTNVWGTRRKNLHDVWGSDNNLFVIGVTGTILHYDGANWRAMNSDANSDLWGVWGSSASDVYAVGGAGTILHYDGMNWVSIPGSNTNDGCFCGRR